MLDDLREKCDLLIKSNNCNYPKIFKLKTIKQMLSFDNCFEKISIEDAYAIFRELEYDCESFQKMYVELGAK